MKKKFVLSGVEPDQSGTGRLLQHLTKNAHPSVQFLYFPFYLRDLKRVLLRKRMTPFFKLAADVFRRSKPWLYSLPGFFSTRNELLLLHPQNLGYFKSLVFLKLFRGRISWFLLDSSFFCLRSYNYRDFENQPCLRCLGSPKSLAQQFGCRPFPTKNWYAQKFFIEIKKMVAAKRIEIIAQNQSQAKLAAQHFGIPIPKAIGLWTVDFENNSTVNSSNGHAETVYDLVFHGHPVGAKGAQWLIQLAQHLPDKKFLFPYSKNYLHSPAPANCTFQPMTWETGLKEAVTKSNCIVVPSLWSAPIEGALVKSLMLGKRVAVVDNPTSFSSELNPSLIVALNPDVTMAARQLAEHLRTPGISQTDRLSWKNHFESYRTAMNTLVDPPKEA